MSEAAASSLPAHETLTPEEAAYADALEGLGPDDRSLDYDLIAGSTVRFDEPSDADFATAFAESPIQLERRGVTSHVAQVPHVQPVPEWQAEFWSKQTLQKNTVAAKLREFGRPDLSGTLEDCHSTWTVALCGDCGRVKRFPNRCDNFFCPECQPRLASERRKAVEWWTKLVCQPKHVVLTVVNIPDLTKAHILEFKRWFSRLRRRKFARNWQGGFYSLEVTNEGRGWHLHVHALVDAKWIDAGELAREWAKVTNGMGNIVCVKDARRHDYLGEVTKYAVKGVDLAKWSGKDIATFVTAFDGVRTFGVFGTLYGARTKFAEFIASLRDAKPKCDCGSCNVSYFTESEWLERDLHPTIPTKPKPPVACERTPYMFADHAQQQAAIKALAR